MPPMALHGLALMHDLEARGYVVCEQPRAEEIPVVVALGTSPWLAQVLLGVIVEGVRHHPCEFRDVALGEYLKR